MADKIANNPFASLFSSIDEAVKFIRSHNNCESTSKVVSTLVADSPKSHRDFGEDTCMLIEWLLLVTASEPPHNTEHACVYLPDCCDPLSFDTINAVLSDRLFLPPPYKVFRRQPKRDNFFRRSQWAKLSFTDDTLEESMCQKQVVPYLSDVFHRCLETKKFLRSIKEDKEREYFLTRVTEAVEDAVITNLHTALQTPDIFEGQRIEEQFIDMLSKSLGEEESTEQLVIALLNRTKTEQTDLSHVFKKMLNSLTMEMLECSLFTINWRLVSQVEYFAKTPDLAQLLVQMPTSKVLGSWYGTTALGSLLSISCLPKQGAPAAEHFPNTSNLTRNDVDATNGRIQQVQDLINERTYGIFFTLLSCKSVKQTLLSWLSDCLSSNLGRAGVWHVTRGAHEPLSNFVPDAFMLNLGDVLCRLAYKFTEDIVSEGVEHKVMQVDPSYCAPIGDSPPEGCYSAALNSLTPLIPANASVVAPRPHKYTFVTSCFFFANTALHLGLSVINQRFGRLQTQLNRLHGQMDSLPSNTDSRIRQQLKDAVADLTASYLTMRAAMLPCANSDALNRLLAATAHWLTQVCQTSISDWENRAPATGEEVILPIPELSEEDSITPENSWLQFIPEFLVDNIANLSMLSRMLHRSSSLGLINVPLHQRYLTFIIAYMGSASRIRNPHHRADLARTLELVLLGEPLSSSTDLDAAPSASIQNLENLIAVHPLADHLPTTLVRVFVSIEMTGQSVNFEEKFNYRVPMYVIMKQLWQIPSQRAVLVALADEALAHMDSPNPPLFLRFVNLLINDNIFLLDEGLSFMTQLKEMHQEKERGDWDSLSPSARNEKESLLHHTSSLARFHNLLARRTSFTLSMLTEELGSLFCHSTLVERVAAMLNYFLDHLVGPKQKQFKVKDTEQYEFKPGVVVSLICRVYCHLSNHPSFPAAVIADDRSYSPHLLEKAKSVLIRIGESSLAEELKTLQSAVEGVTQSRKEEDDLTAIAPEQYLDPIMNVLMKDPVTLPTSGIVVDRSTIARHLLSDQSDPFNRQPLNMTQLVPHEQLKTEINGWIESKRKTVQSQANKER